MITSGKWEKVTTSDHPHHEIVVKHDNEPWFYVARICDHHNGQDGDNAALIAASPDLLAACKKAKQAIESGSVLSLSFAMTDLEQAIAKAEL